MTRRAPSFLPAGSALVGWLRAGPHAGSMPWTVISAYRWRAYWFDRNWRHQEELCPTANFAGFGGDKLVFVLGFWRSGTTLLHELLAADPRTVTPRTWQCMNPSAFRVARPPDLQVSQARPMDAVIVRTGSPQEDEFALLARGAPSVYRTWLDPRRWQEVLSALAQETWLSLPDEAWLSDWHKFLGWCVSDDASTLVLKSPNHVFRLKALCRIWPNARFVWVLRDPAETWHSNRRMWSAMAARYGVACWRLEDLDHFLYKAFAEYAVALRWAASTLVPKRLAFLSFDCLVQRPLETMQTLASRLCFGAWEQWQSPLRQLVDAGAGYRRALAVNVDAVPSYAAALVREIRELHGDLLSSSSACGQRHMQGGDAVAMASPACHTQ